MKIAVIGSTMMDVVAYTDAMPAPGETRAMQDFHVACGGKGANQAVAAAKCGAEVLMVTKTGDDIFGARARENFAHFGIDMDYVMTAENTPNGVASIIVDNSSQNRILINKGANDCLTPDDVEQAAPALKQCDMIVLQLEVPLATVYAAIELGRKYDIDVLLNPAPANPDLDISKLAGCAFVMPNETELSLMTGMPVNSQAEIEAAAKKLLAMGVKKVIVTMGHQGSLLVTADTVQVVPTMKVDAVDTTGAGDSYIGCFAANYAKYGDIPGAMQMASAYAALGVTKKGTQEAYGTAQEFADFLKQHNIG